MYGRGRHRFRDGSIVATLALLLIGVTPPGAAAAEATDTLTRVMTVGEAPRIELTHVAGTVEIRAESAPSLSVKVVRTATAAGRPEAVRTLARSGVKVSGGVGAATVQFTWDGASDWDTLKTAARNGKLAGVSLDYKLTVPRRAFVKLSMVGGEVVVDGVEGGVTVHTVGAHALLNRVSGGCSIVTIGGDVTVAGVEGGLAIQTVSGRVRGTLVRGSCVVDSVGGAIALALEPRGRPVVRVRTISGASAISVPEGASAVFDAESGSGVVSDEFAGRLARAGRRTHGQIGKQGVDVQVRSVSGAIVLKRSR